MKNLLSILVFSTLGFMGCAQEGGEGQLPMSLQVDSDDTGLLNADGAMTWGINTIAAVDYEGLRTNFSGNWMRQSSPTQLFVHHKQYNIPSARLVLNDNWRADFAWWQLSGGTYQLFPDPGETRPVDLIAVGMAPRSDNKFQQCEIEEARIILDMSDYPDSPNELMTIAEAQAEDAGKGAPSSWHDMIHSGDMYNFVFEDHAAYHLSETTFVTLGVHLVMRCGDEIVAIKSGGQLTGFVDWK